MSITDTSYDYLKKAIDAFDMLDANARRALFGELRGMLSTALEIQAKNEEFKRDYYSRYALLESSMENQREQIKELETENAELAAKNAQLEIQVNRLTQKAMRTTVHVIHPVLNGNQTALQG